MPGWPTPQVPGLELSPAEMLAHGTARAGRLKVPAHPGMVFDFLPVAWRTIQHYGVEVGGLRYNGPALTRYRNKTSPYTGVHAGKWPVRYRHRRRLARLLPGPGRQRLAPAGWEHADRRAVPFSADALAYARRLALAEGRHADERRALAELLDRWDAGLVRHPAERRMAVRASQQRAARMAAAGHGHAARSRRPARSRRLTGQRTSRQDRRPGRRAAMTTAPGSWTRARGLLRRRVRGAAMTGAVQFAVEERRLEPVGQVRLVRDGRGTAPDPAAGRWPPRR